MDTEQSVSSVASESGSRTRRPGDRSAEIIRAAYDLFISKGFAATKLDDVARAAGVSKGLPYLYFKSKEDLFKAVIVEALGDPIDRANDLIDGHAGSSESLLRELVARFRVFDESPFGGVMKLILAEAAKFPEVARHCTEFDQRGRGMFAKLLRRGIARGEFRPVADVEATAILLSQPLAMHSLWLRSLAPFDESSASDSDRFYASYIDFVLKALRP